jgi:hypothetical protein
MITKYIITALLALCLALGGYGYWAHQEARRAAITISAQKGTIDAQEAALATAEALHARSEKALLARTRANTALIKKHKEAIDALSTIRSSNPGWYDSPLPPGVAEWLRDHANGQGAGQGAAPVSPAGALPSP